MLAGDIEGAASGRQLCRRELSQMRETDGNTKLSEPQERLVKVEGRCRVAAPRDTGLFLTADAITTRSVHPATVSRSCALAINKSLGGSCRLA